ncbi:MAG TPA: type IIL restriction-modification enzyme MmeI [Rhizomicrobium sp.]|jgi:hypothetical protein|nr:type IIL restriction-modification enzyme MmeI [Rhizomicrobium sp.]
MNAVEIEEAISALAEHAFDAAEFPFAFLQAFGNKETTIKRLRAGASNKSDCLSPFRIYPLMARVGSSRVENFPTVYRSSSKSGLIMAVA